MQLTRAVLLVEDDAAIAALLSDILVDSGFEPVVASDGARALSDDFCALAATAAALITDLSLPGLHDGRSVIGALRARRPDLPVIVVTGHTHRDEESDLRGLGGPTIRLHKPFGADDLLDALEAVLGGDPATARDEARRRPRGSGR